MVFAIIKKNNISMSKIRAKCNEGLEPKYQTKYEGIDLLKGPDGKNSEHSRFQKNMARMQGKCKGCKHFVPAKAKTVTGEHCGRKTCDK